MKGERSSATKVKIHRVKSQKVGMRWLALKHGIEKLKLGKGKTLKDLLVAEVHKTLKSN